MNGDADIIPLTLYVVRHPQSPEGKRLGELLHNHFGPARSLLSTGGVPIRVQFSDAAAPGSTQPVPIAWDDSATTAVAILIDDVLAGDLVWLQHVNRISRQAEDKGLQTCAIPVALSPAALNIGESTQALHWFEWEGAQEDKNLHLIREMTYQFIRMLRHQIAEHSPTGTQDNTLGAYLEKVKVFLSHSKHDEHGKSIAESIRNWLFNEASLSTFLDVHDIPAGVSFEPVIEHSMEQSVMAVIYTDSYSSRDWCQREVLQAKRLQAPMLVVDCLRNVDERSSPYMGNAPYLRMDPEAMDRMEHIAFRLLDEMFKSMLWKLHVGNLGDNRPNVTFMPRAPELVSLVTRPELRHSGEWHIVYPEPPLGEQEVQLITNLGQQIRLHSLTQWLSED